LQWDGYRYWERRRSLLATRLLASELRRAQIQPQVFQFQRTVSRALRVLLTCIALAMAMPTGVAVDLQTSVSARASSLAVAPRARIESERVASERTPNEPPRTDSTRAADRSRSDSTKPTELGVQARCRFLLNCSWLC